MRVMVVGSGAREHALVWRLRQEPSVDEVVCAVGNAGIAALARCLPVDIADPEALLATARREAVDLTVVGPELPLTRGARDRFDAAGMPLFGPSRMAARLESSKAYAKGFMERHGIATARARIVGSIDEAARVFGRAELGWPLVLKADGLAAGKGVSICASADEAHEVARQLLVDRRLGEAGANLVLEEHLEGVEASFFLICDGTRAVPLPAARDYKRALDGDRGPNTGGMGALAPSPTVTPDLERQMLDQIVRPVLGGLREEGQEYRGLLYVGVMLAPDGPKVIEFNVRFGDPEAQVVLPMLEGELLPIVRAAATGSLSSDRCPAARRPHVGVVMASGGYPGPFETGFPVTGLTEAEAMPDVLVFHAGTRATAEGIVTSGGRVLTIVARGESLPAAAARAYEAVRSVDFRRKHFRTDIARGV